MHYTSRAGKLFDSFNVIFLAVVAIVTVYPFWDTLVVSIIPLDEYLGSSIHLFPKAITFSAYNYLFSMKELWRSYGVTLFVTVVGTALSMLLTIMAAYVLSRPGLKGNRVFMFLFVFTMMFSGGIIPTYLIVKSLGLMNSVWALIIPSALNTYNLIIMRNFFFALPEGLVEAARIDGCNDVGILYRIAIPLSMPAISTITLFYAVTRWNDFFNAIFFISDKEHWPLQLFLRSMLFENESTYSGGGGSLFLLGPSIKMATVMAATIPIMIIYPFFQKYFHNGVLIGGVKE
ncbi:carbohydrate ABC transporter permease [Paenibacillus lycopersici]|uniref:Carbohydrate ABC transporter permease n=1 Tax=Paenibacillus lycopersici TaxID=2704462 RepID=A0A6C0G431_9BACL|nr:carbohydrate ABC transporter permease [Paenibacillus lycopersici]QHT62843.1 carbohydrate ABC transporter permease [Paenibacillus lycopersici]